MSSASSPPRRLLAYSLIGPGSPTAAQHEWILEASIPAAALALRVGADGAQLLQNVQQLDLGKATAAG